MTCEVFSLELWNGLMLPKYWIALKRDVCLIKICTSIIDWSFLPFWFVFTQPFQSFCHDNIFFSVRVFCASFLFPISRILFILVQSVPDKEARFLAWCYFTNGVIINGRYVLFLHSFCNWVKICKDFCLE